MIYLPEHYSPLYSYPTVYLQDGYDYFSLGKMATQLDHLIAEGKIERCIAVGVPVSDSKKRFDRYSPKGSRHQAYIRFFGEELVSFIDHELATQPISGARAVMGDSLGGGASLAIAMAYPHTFHYAVSQSGAFFDDLDKRIEAYTHSPALLSIYLSIGLQETEVSTSRGNMDLLRLNHEAKERLEQHGFPVYFREFEGDHTWTYWSEDLLHALTHIWGK
ncbi:alpha/beta hydrolase-fold protein [Bacillus horti]